MKARQCSVAIACLLALAGFAAPGNPAAAQTPAAAQRPIPVLAPPQPGFLFPQRETLTFSVDWRVFTAGTAIFHLEQVQRD